MGVPRCRSPRPCRPDNGGRLGPRARPGSRRCSRRACAAAREAFPSSREERRAYSAAQLSPALGLGLHLEEEGGGRGSREVSAGTMISTAKLELELAAEAERGVAEEGHGHDGALEDVDGVHVRNDAAAGLIVVDDGAVDETLGNDAVLHQLLDHQLMHPLGDLVHIARRVEALLARPALLQLGAIRVALAEEVLVAQRGPVHRVLVVQALLGAGHHLVDAGLDLGALVLTEKAHLANAALHLARLLLLLQLLLLIVAALGVRVLLILALGPGHRVRLGGGGGGGSGGHGGGGGRRCLPAARLIVVPGRHGLELLTQVRITAGGRHGPRDAALGSSGAGGAAGHGSRRTRPGAPGGKGFLSARPPCEAGGPGGGRRGGGRGVGPQGRWVMQRWRQRDFLLRRLLHQPASLTRHLRDRRAPSTGVRSRCQRRRYAASRHRPNGRKRLSLQRATTGEPPQPRLPGHRPLCRFQFFHWVTGQAPGGSRRELPEVGSHSCLSIKRSPWLLRPSLN
ncbi:unnamed protein product [Nyctereutes procyonoides]|uniref:(raccoon dog) hypothetical protein n=1 Tax=Nyctereutes procyonoides TaxID=34880 RepID=A0A811ZL38_NYCPR|nr:unnamed protein product [Nyctereutes procyonoides]